MSCYLCASGRTCPLAGQRVYLRVDEADGGFRPDVLLVAGGGRGVEAQHSIVRVCNLIMETFSHRVVSVSMTVNSLLIKSRNTKVGIAHVVKVKTSGCCIDVDFRSVTETLN